MSRERDLDPAAYKDVREGEWVTPNPDGYRMACCGCSLTHKLEFRIVGDGIIQMRGTVDHAATAALRAQQDKEIAD